MSFIETIRQHENFGFGDFFRHIEDSHIRKILGREKIGREDFLALLSDKASEFGSEIRIRARTLTRRHFGRTISLYAPLYLSNHCSNECVYCGFRRSAKVKRRTLDERELTAEAEALAAAGIRHLLVLTGESRKEAPLDYISGCVRLLRRFFASISVEIYPLEISEYGQLVESGVDGLTLYQETYDRGLYDKYHRDGAKRNFQFRLDAPERAARAGIRTINVGALLGLGDFKKDVLFAGLHAEYLLRNFPSVEIGVSVPRIGDRDSFRPPFPVSDADMARIISALRLFLPSAGISLSTRERPELRDSLMESGVTRMSAGSRTEVGGYSLEDRTEGQFETSDGRNAEELAEAISSRNYEPVFSDWRNLQGL